MTAVPDAVTVVLDPYLLLELSSTLPVGTLAGSARARFAVADYLLPDDFHAPIYLQLTSIVDQEKIERLPFSTTSISDLFSMRNSLVLHQVISIATAREHSVLFASACPVFRRKAASVLMPDSVLCRDELCNRFGLA